jgi:tRNAThr (cytosine32-N3)-methyltransferase
VEWDEAKEAEAEAIIASQKAASPHLESAEFEDITESAPGRWDAFYNSHERSFFKDRNWLTAEFPELFQPNQIILEVGCGAGNTSFPILREHKKMQPSTNGVFLHSSDFSAKAVELVREHPEYDSERMHVFLHDLAKDEIFEGIPDGSVDVAVAIFVMSALDPSRLSFAISKIAKVLKPGGIFLFRDYGLHDMTQLRFKPNRMVREDLYLRGDGTAVHYFSQEELESLSSEAGLSTISNKIDRRLLVNRHRKLTMYRIWIQAKFRKC